MEGFSSEKDPTQRFTSRVDHYAKHRPGYPRAVLDVLAGACGFRASWRIADVGSGTGLLAELFLGNGNVVYGVEPNAAMRAAAEVRLSREPNFHSIPGRAEATTLGGASVDFVVAGQAFHWFEPAAARREFARILVPGGWAALIWNERRDTGSPFMVAYEAMLRAFAPEYAQSDHRHIDGEKIGRFFKAFQEHRLENFQLLDWEGICGRLLSSSYVPEAGQPMHDEILRELRRIFEAFNKGGRVNFEYDTRVYVGRLEA